MTRRSLCSSSQGMDKAKQALASKGWTQEYLAGEVGLSSRQSIWKFLTGRPVDRNIFKDICFQLDLDWEEIAELPETSFVSPSLKIVNTNVKIEDLVKVMRAQVRERISHQCSILQSSFELTQPSLQTIYTAIQVLPQPSYQRWLDVSDFHQPSPRNQRSRLSVVTAKAVSIQAVVAKHDKLMILGKPGAGKTTFLQHLALQCNQGHYRQDLIPCFIQLRSEWEQENKKPFNLLDYLLLYCKNCGVSSEKALNLLRGGHFLCLLDGLDEVPQHTQDALCKNIENFTQTFYKNQIIITSRSSAQQFHFKGFTYVEIADFDDQQIQVFAQQWFAATLENKTEAQQKAQQFIQQLEKPENQPIRELAITPILLNLLCSVFKEKATFPRQRVKLYQTGIDILLQRWDQARGIERDGFYDELSLVHKIKLLAQIAATTFSENCYFFESRQVLSIIENYLSEHFNLHQEAENLWLTSEKILKLMEVKHGILVERAKDIYSFSHLTFQEYFTARHIITHDSQTLENALSELANKLFDSRWREVILLSVSMLPKADFLIQTMKRVIDEFAQQDSALIRFLYELEDKVKSMQLSYSKASVRAFYFTLFRHRDLNLAIALDTRLAKQTQLSAEIQLDSILAKAFLDSVNLANNPSLKKFLNLCFTLELDTKFKLKPNFLQALKQLKSQLPSSENDKAAILKWWQTNGNQWTEDFRKILLEYRRIGYDWQLNEQQRTLREQYYDANLFLIECLQGDCNISPDLRETIEATLLLPPQT